MIEQSKHYALAIACGAKRGPKDSDLTFSPASLRDFVAAVNTPAAQPAPAPSSWVETVAVNLVREGINKHKARELAAHFHGLAQQPAAQRQPLTDEHIDQIIAQCQITLVNYCSDEKQQEFARAIEAAHGIGGEA